MPPYLADILMRVHLPFSVNVLAEQAAIAALKDMVFYNETLRVVKEERLRLAEEMRTLNFTVFPSQANFIMVKPPHGQKTDAFFERLLEKGFIIRPLKSYGLDEYLRITIGAPEENKLFIKACKEILKWAR